MKRNIQAPRQMNMSVMRQILTNNQQEESKQFYLSHDFGMGYGINFFDSTLTSGGPFLVDDFRMGILLRGEIDATINLMPIHVRAGQMVFLHRGSIVQLHNISQDLLVKGFIFSPDLVNRLFNQQPPRLLNGTVMHFVHTSPPEDRQFVEQLTSTIWALVHREHYSTPSLHALLSAFIHYYDDVFQHSEGVTITSTDSNRNHLLFNRFIPLVHQHSITHRDISFYADKLCLSPRYLSTVIGEQSGKSAKYWIDEAVVTRAKVMLCHTSLSVSQISAELHFPNDSFFCKYFRRLTGQSPTQYREAKD